MEDNRNLAIYEDIKSTLEREFGYKLLAATPIERGLLNLKWKVETEQGYILIKQYNVKRNPPHKMEQVKVALGYQKMLYESGVKCPKLHTFDGAVVVRSHGGENFVVMDFSEGSLVSPGKANLAQMRDIGRWLAKMHNILNSLLPLDGPADKELSLEVMQDGWQAVWERTMQLHLAEPEKMSELVQILELQKLIIEHFDIGQFAGLSKSWAHEDLWADNILFNEESVSCVVDFDRVRISYAEHDIGRVLLSLALDGDNLEPAKLSAFLAGYGEVRHLTKADILQSLRLTWFMESFWWVKPEMYEANAVSKRFAHEMIWMIMNWFKLDKYLRDI